MKSLSLVIRVEEVYKMSRLKPLADIQDRVRLSTVELNKGRYDVEGSGEK